LKKKNKALLKFLFKCGYILFEIVVIFVMTATFIYLIKSALGIDIFPGWSLFSKL
tara:strand:- start:1397 stop:1561 length:165 start_codon:yes stop_codon:yes gene_type:complete